MGCCTVLALLPFHTMATVDTGTITVTARLGRQGIDGLYVKYNENGQPQKLMVAESKYGSSSLGLTKDGWQLSIAYLSAKYHHLFRL